MDEFEEFSKRVSGVLDHYAMRFGRLAEMLEATTARMSADLVRVKEMQATQQTMSKALDKIEENIQTRA